MKLKNPKIYLIILILILFLILLIINLKEDNFTGRNTINNDNNCIVKTELKEVRGDSLFPLVIPGQEVKILYDCYDIKKGDIIAYNYSGNPNPIIKIVKAIPGDKLELRENNNSFQIIVNDIFLRNSEGELYQIDESKIKMLELYSKSYPILPENTYLILGNQISGTLDSTKFGLIHKDDILGKIVY